MTTPSSPGGHAGVRFSDVRDITAELGGVTASENGIHGGHQTRVVRTPGGTFAAYITAQTDAMNEFSIMKINDDGTSRILYQDYQNYDSSSVNIFADSGGTVYVASLTDDKLSGMSTPEGAFLCIYRVDPVTLEVQGYTARGEFGESTSYGYGYSMPVPDFANRKIYAIFCAGNLPGLFAWFTFDLDTMAWEKDVRTVTLPSGRHCYLYCFADGRGGAYVVGQRDVLRASVGKDTFRDADYVWDNWDLFRFPDMTKEAFTEVRLVDADALYTPEWYPNTVGTSAFLDRDGFLHLLYRVRMYPASAIHGDTGEIYLGHAVFRDGARLFDRRVGLTYPMQGERRVYDPSMPSGYCTRLVQTPDESLYLIALPTSGYAGSTFDTLELWRADDALGKTWSKIAEKKLLTSTEPMAIDGLAVTGTLPDGVVGVLYHENTGSGYALRYLTVTLPSRPAG